MHILLATDAAYVIDDVVAALGGPDVSFTVCREGREVSRLVGERADDRPFDLVVCDLQIGSKGGMAVTMDLRLDESAGRLPRVPVLLLLDRRADVHLAERCDADAYLVKPLDPLALQRGAAAAMARHEPEPAVDEEVTADAG